MPLAKILNSWEKCEIQSFSWPLWWSRPACLLSVPGQRARGPDSALLPPHTQCNPFWSPLLFMLYWSKELPNPLPYPPPALTHTHWHKHTPSKIAGTAQIGGAPWESRVTGSGVRQLQKRKTSERGWNIYRINLSEFHWLHKLLWSCYTPSARPAPFAASFPLWKLWQLL